LSPDHQPTTVRFLRKQARDAGDLGTVRGRALHKAAAQFIRLGEELLRCSRLVSEQVPPDRLELAAQGIHLVLTEHQVRQHPDAPRPEPWERLGPQDRALLLLMARAAHGEPICEVPEDDDPRH